MPEGIHSEPHINVKQSPDKGFPTGGTPPEKRSAQDLIIPFPDGKSIGVLAREWKKRPNAPEGGIDAMMKHPTFLSEAEKQQARYRAIGMIAANGEVVPLDVNGNIPDDKLLETLFQLPEKVKKRTEQTSREPSLGTETQQQGQAEIATVRATLSTIGHQKENQTDVEALEQKVAELARLTRAQGIGYLHGKFPENLENSPRGYFQTVEGFAQGAQTARGDYRAQQSHMQLESMIPREIPLPHEVWDIYTQTYRQVWTAKPYTQHKEEYEMKTGMFKKEKRVHIPSYEGKTGPETGVQYDYFMPVLRDYDPAHRPGVFVNMSVVVPEEIAREIDSIDLELHPDFPDRYFKALFPGIVGPNKEKQITREPATELFVRDLRKNPNRNEGKVIQYPKPISN